MFLFSLFPPRLQLSQTLWLGTLCLAKGCGSGQKFYLWLKGTWASGKGKIHAMETGFVGFCLWCGTCP